MTSGPPLTPTPISPRPESLKAPNLGEATPVAILLAEVNALAIRLKQKAKAIPGGPGELLGAEHAVLDIIERVGALTVPQIARERSTSRQNIQILVDRLAAQGRIELVTNPAHKRSDLVRLTERGRTWLAAGEEGRRQTLLEVGSQLSELEINSTTCVLRKVHSLLSGAPEKDQVGNTARSRRAPSGRAQASPSVIAEAESEREDFPINLL
jgi:DNA-binding MarR family transcriptional regulator